MPRKLLTPIFLLLAVSAQAAGVRTYEVPNNPQWDSAGQPNGDPTRIEQLRPNDNNSYIIHGPVGTYGCSYIAATKSVQCP